MCGLSAVVEFGAGGSLLPILAALHQRCSHRGPDGESFTVVDTSWRASNADSLAELETLSPGDLRLGLGFHWLQIQDPRKAAMQPMASPDGTVWLIFNGEIYNFQDIRAELEALGHKFATVGDTEVLLAAYLQWGCGCFERLNGMWAVVLVDLRRRKIVMSRDRFGIKPLYYSYASGRLLIASEVKQLLAAGVPATANRPALHRFIRGLRPAVPEETFFRDVFAQPAATYAELSLESPRENLTFQGYWRLEIPPADAIAAPPLARASVELENLLRHSVADHMIAQAPIAHLISGGLDSSLVAALAAPIYAARGEHGTAISMVLKSADNKLDESVYIDAVTGALQFRSHKAEFSPQWLKANLAKVTWTQEEPVAGMAVAGQFLAYQLAAQYGAKVVIDGQGADELFGGYRRHQYALMRDRLKRMQLLALVCEMAWQLRRDPGFFWDMWRQSIVPRIARKLGFTRNGGHDFLRGGSIDAALPAERATAHNSGITALSRMLQIDVTMFNLKSVLSMTDRNAMAHSIEGRVPFVDRRIADFAFALPDSYKVGHGQRKRILRKIAARYLPASIVSRIDRIGFGAPIALWLGTEFRAELFALADGDVFARATLTDRAGLRNFIERFLAGRHHDAGTVWRLYAIDLWARTFAVSGI